MTSTITQTLTETNMSKEQVAYAIAKAHLETLQAEMDEICKAEREAYTALTGHEADEIIDEIIDNLTNAEINAELKLGIYDAKTALTQAENDMINWGKKIVMSDRGIKAKYTPADYDMVMSVYEKALKGHITARPKVIELTFNLQPD